MSIAELERPSPPAFDVPRTEQRSRLELVPSVFPALRPCDDARFRPARRKVPALGVHVSATAWLLAEALQAMRPAGGRSIVDRRHADLHDPIRPLVADESCEIRIGGAAVTGALRLALLAWLPPSRAELAFLEQGLFQDVPANALALLLRPPTIWSLGEAVTAARLYPGGASFEPERFRVLERHGRERVGGRHLARTRAAVARLERQLPFPGFPVASVTVAAGCRVLATDDAPSAVIAARELARYATSSLVARAAR